MLRGRRPGSEGKGPEGGKKSSRTTTRLSEKGKVIKGGEDIGNQDAARRLVSLLPLGGEGKGKRLPKKKRGLQ